MERHGFIRDMLDVKVLILYVMARVWAPIDADTVYALCYQDECLSYFDVKEALPQLVQSGHLDEHNRRYAITEKGREQGAVTADAIPYPVLQRAAAAVDEYNKAQQSAGSIRAEVIRHDPQNVSTVMTITDGRCNLLQLELAAPNVQQAERLAETFRAHSSEIYSKVLHALLDRMEANDHATL